MKKIGITGGVGCGKTTVLEYLSDVHGATVIVADRIAHMLEAKGEPCYNELVRQFGSGILDEDGEIDKFKFAELVFSAEATRQKANEIIHPAVNQYILDKMKEAEEKGIKLFIVESALLLENGYGDILDELWYVYTDDKIRTKRLMESRGYSQEKTDSIMASQLSEDDFRTGCDRIITNNNDIKKTFKQIDELLGVN